MQITQRRLIMMLGSCIMGVAAHAAEPPGPPPEGGSAVPAASVVVESGAAAVPLETPGEIEAAIMDLAAPLDEALVSRAIEGIRTLEDAQEQARLQQALNDRVAELAGVTPEPTTTPSVTAESSDEELLKHIAALTLGRDATAAELRERDDVVSAIVGIEDPIRREAMLEALERRERDAETVVFGRPAEAAQGASH